MKCSAWIKTSRTISSMVQRDHFHPISNIGANSLHSQTWQCDRVVKVMDSKSIGLCPQGFKSPRCRFEVAGCCFLAVASQCNFLCMWNQFEDWNYCILLNMFENFPLQSKETHYSRGLLHIRKHDSVTEWLRWWTRNPLGSARRGSNPLAVGFTIPSDSLLIPHLYNIGKIPLIICLDMKRNLWRRRVNQTN